MCTRKGVKVDLHQPPSSWIARYVKRIISYILYFLNALQIKIRAGAWFSGTVIISDRFQYETSDRSSTTVSE